MRGFWNLRLVLLRRALTRTSVGNEKYKYEDEKRCSARIHKPIDQCELAGLGRAAGTVAVRHKPTLNELRGVCQRFFANCFADQRSADSPTGLDG